MDGLIPIVAITSAIGIPAAVIIIALFLSHRKKVARYTLIEKSISANASPEVVEQLVKSIGEQEIKKKTPPRTSNLIHGTILLALGISFFAMLFFVNGPDDVTGFAITGLVLTLLAVAKFTIAFFILKKDPEQS